MADPCEPFEAAMRMLGRRWTGGVVRALLGGARRFGEIRGAVPGISDPVLTTRLRELCAAGVATREVTDGPPVRVAYVLTPAGRDLRPVLNAVEHYGSKHRELLERFDGR